MFPLTSALLCVPVGLPPRVEGLDVIIGETSSGAAVGGGFCFCHWTRPCQVQVQVRFPSSQLDRRAVSCFSIAISHQPETGGGGSLVWASVQQLQGPNIFQTPFSYLLDQRGEGRGPSPLSLSPRRR